MFAERSLAVHPLQLYFLSANVFMALVAWMMIRSRVRDGGTFLTFVSIYGISKFLLEALREPARPISAYAELGFGLIAIGILTHTVFTSRDSMFRDADGADCGGSIAK
jgi:prolipoprotein diacylglyceryltransferase